MAARFIAPSDRWPGVLSEAARFIAPVVDDFVVMPNHLHGILWLASSGEGKATQSLGQVIRAFKARVTFALRSLGQGPIFQSDFHDHIIREEADLERVRAYILENPARWGEDPDNPGATREPRDESRIHGGAR